MMLAIASAIRFRSVLATLWVAALSFGLSACGGEPMPDVEGRARSAWQAVRIQYAQRSELIPPILAAVSRSAPQEREIVGEVAAARQMAISVSVDDATMTNPERFKRYQQAQDALSLSLERLNTTIERYLELKSGSDFASLRSQLRDTDLRLAIARRDYTEAARTYNEQLSSFPGRWINVLEYEKRKPLQVFTAGSGGSPTL